MQEEIVQKELEEKSVVQEKKPHRYNWWTRLIALILVIALLMSITAVDFSLLRYQGTDQMAAAQYLMDSTPYLGQNRLERLKSLLSGLDSFSLNLQAAEIAIGKTDYDRAAHFLEKSIPLSPDADQTAELYNRLGCVYMLGEKPSEAQQAFDNSIAQNPEEPIPYLLRAQLRYQNGDASGASQDAVSYLDLGGSDSEMLSTAASICELGGNLEYSLEAMNRLVAAVEDGQEKALAYAERGRVQYLMGRNEEAIADLNKAKKMDDTVLTGVHYAILGLFEYDAGDYENSREDFLNAARLSEEGNAAYYEQAIMCGYLTGDFDFIKRILQEAENKGMMTASSLMIQGILLFSEERYEEAEKALTASIDTGTIVAGSYYYRGLSRLAVSDFENAAEDFTQALKWEDNKLSCLFNRGVCYYALGETEKAEEDLNLVAENQMDLALAASARELLDTF